MDVEILNVDPPATSSPAVINAIRASVADLPGLKQMDMVSRAYHDSLFMAQKIPTAMIFIPCRNGWSHRPDEFASHTGIRKGVTVLAFTLARLASEGEAEFVRREEL